MKEKKFLFKVLQTAASVLRKMSADSLAKHRLQRVVLSVVLVVSDPSSQLHVQVRVSQSIQVNRVQVQRLGRNVRTSVLS